LHAGETDALFKTMNIGTYPVSECPSKGMLQLQAKTQTPGDCHCDSTPLMMTNGNDSDNWCADLVLLHYVLGTRDPWYFSRWSVSVDSWMSPVVGIRCRSLEQIWTKLGTYVC